MYSFVGLSWVSIAMAPRNKNLALSFGWVKELAGVSKDY